MDLIRLRNHYTDLFEPYRQSLAQKQIELQLDFCFDEVHRIAQLYQSDAGYTIMMNGKKLQSDDQFIQIMDIYHRNLLLGCLSISTPRLRIRRIRTDDIAEVHRLVIHPRIVERNGYDGERLHRHFDHYFKNVIQNPSEYAIESIEKQRLIGMISLRPIDTRAVATLEIGYNIDPEHWRKGYAFEALQALIQSIFDELRFDMVIAGVFDDNIASSKLLLKLGFECEGRVHKAQYFDLYGPRDLIYYALQKE